MLTVFAVTLLMAFSINVSSQDKQGQPEPEKSMCESMMNDKAMMKACMSQMDSDMMKMCSEMMAKMNENSSMCCNGKEMKGDKPEKENPSDESKRQKDIPEHKG